MKRRVWQRPMYQQFMQCWITFLVQPLEGLGMPITTGLPPDMWHRKWPTTSFNAPGHQEEADLLAKSIDRAVMLDMMKTSRDLMPVSVESVDVPNGTREEEPGTGQPTTDSPDESRPA